ncbi:hypothetical protein C3Z06_09620 [Cupriavidus metallidurans]|nr:hypothetical protein C3Z06_09620 [Cupriavidus metallidurans]
MFFDLRFLPPELRQLLVAEIVLVLILVVAVCLWGAHSRRMKRGQTAPARSPRTRSKKRGRR